jgi:DNA-binding PadR family transcriptional regulator
VTEELRRRSGGEFDLAEGTIYPALHRLETSGLLVSNWEVVGGRRRRVYALSRSGQRAVVNRRAGWRLFRSAVDAVFGSEALEAG